VKLTQIVHQTFLVVPFGDGVVRIHTALTHPQLLSPSLTLQHQEHLMSLRPSIQNLLALGPAVQTLIAPYPGPLAAQSGATVALDQATATKITLKNVNLELKLNERFCIKIQL